MSDEALRMNRFTLRFANPDAEQKFALEQARKSLRPVRVALIAMTALIVIAALLGIFVFRGQFSALQRPWMIGVTLAICAVGYWLTRTRAFMQWNQWMLFGFGCAGSAGAIRFAYVLSPEVLTSRGYMALAMSVFAIYSLFRLRLMSV